MAFFYLLFAMVVALVVMICLSIGGVFGIIAGVLIKKHNKNSANPSKKIEFVSNALFIWGVILLIILFVLLFYSTFKQYT